MSSSLPIIENFDELLSVARKVDEGIAFLEKQFENVSNLGLSLDPRKTKREGEDVLDELAEELEEIKADVTATLRSREEALQDRISDNQQIGNFIEQLTNELREMESQLAAKGNYIPYEPPSSLQDAQTRDTDVTDLKENTCLSTQSSFLEPRRVETPESRRKLHSTLLSSNINAVMHSLNVSKDEFVVSPVSARKGTSRRVNGNTGRKDYATSYDLDNNRSMLSEYCDQSHTSNSLAALEKKLNRTDDLVKTPVDPGVSVITMQLLSKTNLKTRVYKENLLG